MLPPLIAALQDPRRYPHPVKSVERIETHISWVLLAGEFAYKIKKPVALGFLDFSTLAARRAYCEEELRLNRRTAPGLYLDVVPVTGTASAPAFGGEGPPIEYALRMRRFAQEALLDRIARRGEFDAQLADRLAVSVARFHAGIAVADAGSGLGTPAAVARAALDNFDQIGLLESPLAEAVAVSSLRAWTQSGSARLAAAFARRQAQGGVRDCHGDLHLGNIALLDGEPVPFDCIEFSAELRWIDVMSEIAFVLMDLVARGYTGLASRWLNRYLEITGDYDGIEVLRYYLVYRAMVRAKVALIRARQAAPGGDAESAFVRRLRLAERLAASPGAALILMHGVSGSGKTVVSQVMLQDLAALRVRSDVERRRLHGLPAGQSSGSPVGGGLYGSVASNRTYERLAEVAELALRSGWRIIVDAASLQRAWRDRFRDIARSCGAPFVLVSCNAPEAALRMRLERRRALGTDASEATPAVLEHQLATQEPLQSDEWRGVVFYDASAAPGALEPVLQEVVAQVAARLDPDRALSHLRNADP